MRVYFIAKSQSHFETAGLRCAQPPWRADGDDDQVIGLLNVKDVDAAIDQLEAAGIMWLPNHERNQVIKPEHAKALAKHGVLPTHTTSEAMALVYKVSGYGIHKISKF
jgi:hypothetical protein